MSGVLYLSFIIYLNYLNQKLALVFLYPSLHLHPLGKIWHGVPSYPLSEDHRSLRLDAHSSCRSCTIPLGWFHSSGIRFDEDEESNGQVKVGAIVNDNL